MTGQSHTLEGWEPLSAEQLTYDVAQAWVRTSRATCSQRSVSAELAREPHQCCGTGVRGWGVQPCTPRAWAKKEHSP